jgi:hypothetical protein
VQTLTQYVKWIGNQTGQFYSKLYLSASAPLGGILYSKSYASPVPTSYVGTLNGTPILTPTGKFYMTLAETSWTGINIRPLTPGEYPAKIMAMLEILIDGVWCVAIMNNENGTIYWDNEDNQTFTAYNLDWEINYTNGDATAIRISLECYGGTIQQTTAGGNDLGAYNIKSSSIGYISTMLANLRIPLYDGTNSKLTLTPNTANPYPIQYNFPVANFNILGFTSPSMFADLYFIQPSGGTSGNSIELWNNDGNLSHLQTTTY